MTDGKKRADIQKSTRVSIVLKADQRTHPHSIKVMLEDGQVDRVQEVLE